MKERGLLFFLVIVSVLIQIFLAKHTRWTLDLVLLIVIFIGIFRGPHEAVIFGILAGFLRGIFSVDTLEMDIALFPVLGAVSYMLGGMFYRQNLFTQIFITLAALFAVVTSHTLYLNAISGNDIKVSFMLFASWRTFFVTAIISPFIFYFLRSLARLE